MARRVQRNVLDIVPILASKFATLVPVLHVVIWGLLRHVSVARIPRRNAVWIQIMKVDGVAVRFVGMSFRAESILAKGVAMKGCAAAVRS